MLVSNTDDNLRNHGFLLVPSKGWQLSAAYDMNPVLNAHGLRLNVSEANNAQDIDLALSVAPYFRITVKDANAIIERSQAGVRAVAEGRQESAYPGARTAANSLCVQAGGLTVIAEWRKRFDLDVVIVVQLRQRRKIQTRDLADEDC